MGKRRAAWISAVKKALACESKEEKEKMNNQRQKWRKWFGKQRSKGFQSPSSALNLSEDGKLIQAENEQNRQAYSVALVTAMAAEAAVAAAHAAAEVVRLRAAAVTSTSGNSEEKIAAIKIQTAFRGYLARRRLRALRGLVRLKSAVTRDSIKQQASATLKWMQTVAHVESEVRARRIRMLSSNKNSLTYRQIHKGGKEVDKSRISTGENWDDSLQSKEQIEATLHSRQEAAMRRERALAYAYSHQQTWRISSNSGNQTFMDPNNRQWSWSWLEHWMSSRPWEYVNTTEKERKITYAPIPSPKSQAGSRTQRPLSPRHALVKEEDSKINCSSQSEKCRRLSTKGSPTRDDESLLSSPPVPGYMGSTESAKAKSRLPSPLGTPDSSSVKKRLSFSGAGSPGGPKRHSATANRNAKGGGGMQNIN